MIGEIVLHILDELDEFQVLARETPASSWLGGLAVLALAVCVGVATASVSLGVVALVLTTWVLLAAEVVLERLSRGPDTALPDAT